LAAWWHRPAMDARLVERQKLRHRDRPTHDRVLIDDPVETEAGTDETHEPAELAEQGEPIGQDEVGHDIADPPALAQRRCVPLSRGQFLRLRYKPGA
jgi:hypothetical protein